jgi:hypothetical protein
MVVNFTRLGILEGLFPHSSLQTHPTTNPRPFYHVSTAMVRSTPTLARAPPTLIPSATTEEKAQFDLQLI